MTRMLLQTIEQIGREKNIASDVIVDKLIALGIISVMDLEDVGVAPLVNELGIDAAVAQRVRHNRQQIQYHHRRKHP